MHLRQSIQRRQAYKSGSVFKIGPTTARYAVLALLAVFSLFYLIQSAQAVNLGIEAGNIKKETDGLNKKLTTLQVNQSRILSLQNLDVSAQEQGLIPVSSNIEVITLPSEDE